MYEAWNYVGYTNRKLGNYEAALTAYDRALTLKPDYPEAIEYRGHAYLGLNRLDDAKQAYLTLFGSNRKLAAQLLAGMQAWVGEHRGSRVRRRRLARGLRLLGQRTQRHRQPDREPHARRRQRRLVKRVRLRPLSASLRVWPPVALGVGGHGVAVAARRRDFHWHLPRGFPEPAVPADNPMNDAKVALGARLFADPRLSINGRYSCQSCHSPGRAFTDGLARSRGATGATLPLNAPTLFNAAYNASLGWKRCRRAHARTADARPAVQ